MAHILVVDDERSICELLEITFRKDRHRVEVAHNGESGEAPPGIADFRHRHFRYSHAGYGGVDLLEFTKEISPSTVFPVDHRRAHRGDGDRGG